MEIFLFSQKTKKNQNFGERFNPGTFKFDSIWPSTFGAYINEKVKKNIPDSFLFNVKDDRNFDKSKLGTFISKYEK